MSNFGFKPSTWLLENTCALKRECQGRAEPPERVLHLSEAGGGGGGF